MSTTCVVGEGDLPEGILVILDPGLARFRLDGDRYVDDPADG
jgi:hypothetical protein